MLMIYTTTKDIGNYFMLNLCVTFRAYLQKYLFPETVENLLAIRRNGACTAYKETKFSYS